jgi:hypothetical protein
MNEVGGSWNAWDDEHDGVFFAVTSRLFNTSFLAGASVLLGSYDDDPAPTRSTLSRCDAGEPGNRAAQRVATA